MSVVCTAEVLRAPKHHSGLFSSHLQQTDRLLKLNQVRGEVVCPHLLGLRYQSWQVLLHSQGDEDRCLHVLMSAPQRCPGSCPLPSPVPPGALKNQLPSRHYLWDYILISTSRERPIVTRLWGYRR